MIDNQGTTNEETLNQTTDMMSEVEIAKGGDFKAPETAQLTIGKGSEQTDSLARILARPILHEQVEWDMTSNKTYDFGAILDTNAIIKARLLEFGSMNFTPVMRFTLTSDAFDAGACMAGFSGLTDAHDRVTISGGKTEVSGNKHVVMDLRENSDVTIRGAWSHRYELTSTAAVLNATLGTFFLSPLSGILSAVTPQTVSLTVSYWLEDVTLEVLVGQSGGPNVSNLDDKVIAHSTIEVSNTPLSDCVATPTYLKEFILDEINPPGFLVGQVDVLNGGTHLANMSNMFEEIAGTVLIQLLAVKTPYHRGILRLSYGDGPTAERMEWDLAKQSTFCVRMPLFQRGTGRIVSGVPIPLRINVHNKLRAPATVSQEVKILAYVSSDDLVVDQVRGNFKIADPAAEPLIAQGWNLECEEGEAQFGRTVRPINAAMVKPDHYLREEMAFLNGPEKQDIISSNTYAAYADYMPDFDGVSTGINSASLIRYVMASFAFLSHGLQSVLTISAPRPYTNANSLISVTPETEFVTGAITGGGDLNWTVTNVAKGPQSWAAAPYWAGQIICGYSRILTSTPGFRLASSALGSNRVFPAKTGDVLTMGLRPKRVVNLATRMATPGGYPAQTAVVGEMWGHSSFPADTAALKLVGGAYGRTGVPTLTAI